jgi:hypothetical protein
MERAAIREATPAMPVVVPDGKGRGRRFSGGEEYGEADLRCLQALIKEDLWGMGGRVELILLSLAGMQQGELGDLGEISAKRYELMDDDGRGKIGELFQAGLTLGSAGVAGSVLSVLQRSCKEGKFFAVGTLGRGLLPKKLGDMKLVKSIRSKKSGGGRSEAVYELLSESVGQRTYVYTGMKIAVEIIYERLAGIDGEVAEGGFVGM